MRIGHGYDVHPFISGRPLIIGGVNINWNMGLSGHSDGDVLLHAICDACLGSIGQGDIGQHYSPQNSVYENVDSLIFLHDIKEMMDQERFRILNLDCTIVAERPKMSEHFFQMKTNISKPFNLDLNQVNIKATTTDRLGFCGREEGIACYAAVLITKK